MAMLSVPCVMAKIGELHFRSSHWGSTWAWMDSKLVDKEAHECARTRDARRDYDVV